ncbi:M48 family metallopeptidase [Vibrio vulnificus]|uniref:M48 metallopeptidase family protein n=1 Tax=Vibrio vulnificus TaxID=672 RepID=UPI0022A99577|nr:M48 family metallopeptidase [Vibrio vulnificus]
MRYWQKETGLEATTFRIKKFEARWANCCTDNNVLEFHPRCMEFSHKAMDYIIIHELCHTVEKNHNWLPNTAQTGKSSMLRSSILGWGFNYRGLSVLLCLMIVTSLMLVVAGRKLICFLPAKKINRASPAIPLIARL